MDQEGENKLYFKNKYQAFKSFKFPFIWHIIAKIIYVLAGLIGIFFLNFFWFELIYNVDGFSWTFLYFLYFFLILISFFGILYFLIFSSIKELFLMSLFDYISYTKEGIFLFEIQSKDTFGNNACNISVVRKRYFNFTGGNVFIDSFIKNQDNIEIKIKHIGIFKYISYSKYKIYLPPKELNELYNVLQKNISKENSI